MRVGLVGFGRMGRRHARSLNDLAEVDFVGVADRAESAGRHGISKLPIVPDVERLLELGPEAVVIATPPTTQRDLALRLADAGVHALIEKPLTGSSPEAAKVADRYSTSDLVAAVGYVERCNSAVIDLRHRILRGELGKLLALGTERIGAEPPGHSEVGVTIDLATHDIDPAMWIGGGRLEISRAEAVFAERTGVDRHIEAVGRVGDGTGLGPRRLASRAATPQGHGVRRRRRARSRPLVGDGDLSSGERKRSRRRHPRPRDP